MATAEWAHSYSNSNDVEFRLWGSTLSTKLQSLPGLTKTADTGQVDWLTVTKPSSGVYVNEFYYLNDSLHGTYPIYFQIKYGSSGYTPLAPFVQISVGTGTNGTGTLTNSNAAGVGMYQPNGATTTPLLNFISAGEGYLTMIVAIGTPNGAGAPALAMYNFSRFCDDSGTPITGGGILYIVEGSANTTRHVIRDSTWYTDANNWGMRISAYPTTIYNDLPQIMPDFIHQTPKFGYNPNAVNYLSTEYANYVAFRATPMGVLERQYITFGTRISSDVFRQAYRYQ